eukprot:703427-Hanusia_phi.AAC.2
MSSNPADVTEKKLSKDQAGDLHTLGWKKLSMRQSFETFKWLYSYFQDLGLITFVDVITVAVVVAVSTCHGRQLETRCCCLRNIPEHSHLVFIGGANRLLAFPSQTIVETERLSRKRHFHSCQYTPSLHLLCHDTEAETKENCHSTRLPG